MRFKDLAVESMIAIYQGTLQIHQAQLSDFPTGFTGLKNIFNLTDSGSKLNFTVI
jgi:hypothetical protein